MSEELKGVCPTKQAHQFLTKLKDIEKEYQGIDAIVAKYKEFMSNLIADWSVMKIWAAKINEWSSMQPEHQGMHPDTRKRKKTTK